MEVEDLSKLALQKVKITGDVVGKFGSFEIEQVYKNDTRNVLEVDYTFPIIETATIVGFEIIVGEKHLKGKCKEKEKAKKEYQENIVKGNSAYMMEQENDSVFKISIGKIDKDEEVTVKIQYIDKFEITDNEIQILIPTLVTPKYKSSVTKKLSYGNVDYTVDFNISIDKALNRKSIRCPSHEINVIDDDKVEIIEVLNYDLSRDFKLLIKLKNELSSNAITAKTRDGKNIIYLSFMPEIEDSYEDSEKEYEFIIDISGSMMGEKILETKKAVIECLKNLDEGDRFNIIAFESEFEAMNISSLEYNEENLQKAINYVSRLQPMGGTEILDPIKFALYEKNQDKVILLFTDGQVGNENEIIKFVEDNIGKSRIFPFGIDTNVNTSFIKDLAKVGNGKAELIQPNERIDDKIIRTFARIQTPLLEDLKIDYGKNKLLDEIREEKCLFNYEFFNLFAKVENLEDDIQLKGKILDKEYIWKINKDGIFSTNVDLELLFAKQEIERLEDYILNTHGREKRENYKNMIIELSEKYNINSKYTSFITVYERDEKLIAVPKYQRTKLSNKFLKNTLVDMLCMDECREESYVDTPPYLRKNHESTNLDLDIPCFLRKVKVEPTKVKSAKTNEEILVEKVDSYHNEFISKEVKSILTCILYALYYLIRKDSKLKYNEVVNYLRKHKTALVENEVYSKLLCLCYRQLGRYESAKKDTLELLAGSFKKIAITNLKIVVDLNKISETEIDDIVSNDKVADNIDEILWYLINK